MFNTDFIEETVRHVKNLVDIGRCGVCDRIDGTRMKFACGHTSCDDCAVASVDCYQCLTPQTTFQEPLIDEPLTRRVKNAVNLLNVFQDEFHIDVHKRQRLSEQLKIEKEIFPKCIQAPTKYFNKRKSLQNSKHNKENKLSQLPGEQVNSFLDHKMDQRNVEQWLDKYVRKPFTVLNANSSNKLRTNSNPKINNHHVALDSENISTLTSTRKRSYYKTALDTENQSTPNKSKIKTKTTKTKRPKIEQTLTVKNVNKNNNFMDKEIDESGIVLDEDVGVIVIDDSQTIVDKDKAALQAVLDAENKHSESVTISECKEPVALSLQNINNANIIYKVPFYLKSSLSKIYDNKAESLEGHESKDVSITIKNKSFTTTINVKKIDVKNEVHKQSVEIQTELRNDENYSKNNKEFVKELPPACEMQENDKIEVEKLKRNDVNRMFEANKTQNVIIEESDSDEELNAGISMSVKAEIHRSCEEMDNRILGAVGNLEEHSKRPRRAARGHTPASTDSSEKENFNPNRKLKTVCSKKKPRKK